MKDQILKDILTKMYYDNSKTLNENFESRPRFLSEGIIFPLDKHMNFSQAMFQRKDGSTCDGGGMFGFCEYGYCNIMMPSMCTKGNEWMGIGDLFGDGYYYYRWCGDNKKWYWLRVPNKDNKIGTNFNPITKMDINAGTMDSASNCSSQVCRDVMNQKITPWVQYVTKKLKEKCNPVFNSEQNISKLNTSKVLKYGDKDKTLGLPYVYRLQQVMRNLAELNGITLGMGIDGDFGKNTLNAVRELFKKDSVSIKEVEDKITTITGGSKAPYPEYFQNVGMMKRLGWANTTCPKCVNSGTHFNVCAFKEIDRINAEITKYIPYRDCQTITIDKGTNGVEIPNYSIYSAYSLISRKVGVRADTIGNQGILGAGVATGEQITQIQKDKRRPYFTYFFLRDFYFDTQKIQPTTEGGIYFSNEVWPDGPYQFMKTFYQTDNVNSILSMINTFKPQIEATNCTDMQKSSDPSGVYSDPLIKLGGKGDAHTMVSVIEIGTLLLGLIPSPLSPFLLGVSTVAGLADAGLYYAEGDPYMGSMMLALEVIPGGELLSVLKKGKVIGKLGKEGTSELLQKAAKNQLDDVGLQTYKQVEQELTGPIGKEIAQKAEKTVINRVKTSVAKNFDKLPFSQQLKTFTQLVNLCWNTMGKIPQMIIKVGGTAYTIDQLYLAINGRDEDRQNSDIRRLYYILKGYEGILPEEKAKMEKDQAAAEKLAEKQAQLSTEMEKAAQVLENQMKTAPDNLIALGIKVSQEGYNPEDVIEFMRGRVKTTKTVKTNSGEVINVADQVIPTPEYEDVRNGTAFYSLGMSGDTFAQLKKEFIRNWGDTLADTGIDISKLKENPDTFDENLLTAVVMFQKNIAPQLLKENLYDLEAGTIGSKTLKAMRTIPESMKIQTKKITPYSLQKDEYNFFSYSPRTQQWNPISFEEYSDFYNQGLENRLKAVRKETQPIVTNRVTQQPPKRKRLFNR
jgi:hypothetical protein